MKELKYIPFFISAGILLSNPLYGQEVRAHLGSSMAESWDAISAIEENRYFFAMGFNAETEVNGIPYTALNRDVLIGDHANGTTQIFGQLSSAARTKVSFISTAEKELFLGGNAFSYLLYRGDTVFSNPGINSPFLLHINDEGELLEGVFIKASGSAILLDGSQHESGLAVLLQINDSVKVGDNLFIPSAGKASLLLHWNKELDYDSGKLIDGTGAIEATEIAVHEESIYMAGQFQGAIFTENDSIFTGTADNDGFLLKTSMDGTAHFLKHLKGVYEDNVNDLLLDEEHVYIGGQFTGAIAFDKLQIIAGLSKGGYIGVFNHSGEAQWLYGLYGSDNITSLEKIKLHNNSIELIAYMGQDITYRDDTLALNLPFGSVSSAVITINLEGYLREMQVFRGNPLLFLNDILYPKKGGKLYGVEFSGQYGQTQSNGSYDLLLFSESGSFARHMDKQRLHPYPNPVTDELHFEGDIRNARYFIYTIHGQLVQAGISSYRSINVTALQSGIYTIVLEVDGDRILSGPFIKIE